MKKGWTDMATLIIIVAVIVVLAIIFARILL
jgi:hypothetical protein